jgi:hypothetical protein
MLAVRRRQPAEQISKRRRKHAQANNHCPRDSDATHIRLTRVESRRTTTGVGGLAPLTKNYSPLDEVGCWCGPYRCACRRYWEPYRYGYWGWRRPGAPAKGQCPNLEVWVNPVSSPEGIKALPSGRAALRAKWLASVRQTEMVTTSIFRARR